jgi:hypothetical protein
MAGARSWKKDPDRLEAPHAARRYRRSSGAMVAFESAKPRFAANLLLQLRPRQNAKLPLHLEIAKSKKCAILVERKAPFARLYLLHGGAVLRVVGLVGWANSANGHDRMRRHCWRGRRARLARAEPAISSLQCFHSVNARPPRLPPRRTPPPWQRSLAADAGSAVTHKRRATQYNAVRPRHQQPIARR